MVNVCHEHGLFDRWEARYLPTHCDGGKVRKALRAAASLARFAALLAAGRKALFVGLARLARVPYILHVHAGDFEAFYRRTSRFGRALLRNLYANAAAVIALSPAWRAPIEAVVPEARVVVVPNPVSIPAWNPRAAPRRPVALFLGVVRPEKGVYELLAAWGQVLSKLPDARLVIAGSGELDRARALAGELGLGDTVDFPGWIDAGAKARLLANASVLVLPSHFEALPMAVLEGMAAGLPIVATRVGAIPDAVGEDAGLLVPPRDPEALAEALVTALGEEPRRIAMGAAARLRARDTYSADVVVPAIEQLWASVTPDSKRTNPWVAAGP
jgi:glycosyltransferase involved in cell wall biosynthesis